jgi:copper oxidase (laccase) domain-containing protein
VRLLNPFGPAVTIALSDRADGNMHAFDAQQRAEVASSRAALFAAAHLDPAHVYTLRLTYDRDDYCQFVRLDHASPLPTQPTDGVYTTDPTIGLLLTPADCLALVTYDPTRSALMLTHCGRHGLEQQAATAAIRYMQRLGSRPSDIHAWLGPAAGASNYPLHQLGNISMEQATIDQLLAADVPAVNFIKSAIDTTTHPDYFSHSQGDRTQRFAVLVRLNAA